MTNYTINQTTIYGQQVTEIVINPAEIAAIEAAYDESDPNAANAQSHVVDINGNMYAGADYFLRRTAFGEALPDLRYHILCTPDYDDMQSILADAMQALAAN